MIWSLTPKRVPEDAREIDASLRDQAGGVWVAAESKIVAVAVVGPNENGPDVDRARADIHDGQEHKRSIQGPDTEVQDP